MKYKYQILLIIALCFLSRIPQLASPYLFLDGDECLVGLMAKHMYQGREFPLFFWGQQYGLTVIECLFIIPFYTVLGVTTLAVKLGILSLWTLGVVFLFKTLRLLNRSHTLLPFILTLVFVCMPAWAIWAMKARGGYVTAFTLSNIVLYLLFEPRLNNKTGTWILTGVLIAFIYQAHVFWLCGVLPLVAYAIYSAKKIKGAVAMLISGMVLLVAFEFYKKGLPQYYTAPTIFPDKWTAWLFVKRLPLFLYSSLHGNYYFHITQPPNFFCAALSVIFSIILFALPLVGVYYLVLNRKGNMLFVFSVLFVPACFFYTLFSPAIQGRYLLPVTGYALIPILLLLNKVRYQRPVFICAGVIIAAGIVSLITFWSFEFLPWRKDTVLKTVKYLEQNDVKYVFCSDCMVPWQINFYSNESVTARMPYNPERYPKNGYAVNNAFYKGEKTALMHFDYQTNIFHLQKAMAIHDFGVGLNPTKEELQQFFVMP